MAGSTDSLIALQAACQKSPIPAVDQRAQSYRSGSSHEMSVVGLASHTGITAAIAALAAGTLIATPLGILIALYLTEYAGRRAAALVSMTMDVMNGLPAIIVGLFIFILVVSSKGTLGLGQSAYAGGFALAIVMVPLIARGTQGVLRLIPKNQSEAADALARYSARPRNCQGPRLLAAGYI